jgi:HCOMODA/2-hydroxy-3-carboxy-muconic semialdehyde decarboxylase
MARARQLPQYGVLDEFENLGEMLGLVVVRINVDDEEVLIILLHCLPMGVAEQLRRVEILEGDRAFAVRDEFHGGTFERFRATTLIEEEAAGKNELRHGAPGLLSCRGQRRKLMNDASTIALAAFALAAVPFAAAAQPADPDAERIADLVTAYKILVNENILDSFGHVTVRSAKNPNVFYMPRAMPPSLVTKDDVLAVNVADSQPIDPKGRRVNGERYIHGEIYKARPDVQAVIHSHSPSIIPLSLGPHKLRPVVAQAGFLPFESPNFEIRDARPPGDRGMQITDSPRGAALAKTLGKNPTALMRGHGNVVVGGSVKQATVYAAYIDINARMQMQAMLLSPNVVVMNEPELFTPEEFDINRPWEHFKQKTMDEAAKASIDRSQFGLTQTQEKR